ncbi:MAG: ABC transporter permease [Acidobacteriota bacterium]
MAVRTMATRVFVLALASALCACSEAPRRFPEPSAGTYSVVTLQATISGVSEILQAARVSPEFFRSAQVRPLLGRFIVDSDRRAGARLVVVLGYDLWQRRFHASPQVVGTMIQLNGASATIIGIAKPGFNFPHGTLLWVPKQAS